MLLEQAVYYSQPLRATDNFSTASTLSSQNSFGRISPTAPTVPKRIVFLAGDALDDNDEKVPPKRYYTRNWFILLKNWNICRRLSQLSVANNPTQLRRNPIKTLLPAKNTLCVGFDACFERVSNAPTKRKGAIHRWSDIRNTAAKSKSHPKPRNWSRVTWQLGDMITLTEHKSNADYFSFGCIITK